MQGNDASGETREYTVDELARQVGMSARNIRAHQARKLLLPPIRRGRTAYYHSGHVRRLEDIKNLQRQGFNLAAIEAMLGQRQEPIPEALTLILQRLSTEHPALVSALTQHGIVGRADDGTVHAIRHRALGSALELRRAGVPAISSLQILSEVLDATRIVADELADATGVRVLASIQRRNQPGVSMPAFAHGVAGLLAEAFRLAMESWGRTVADDAPQPATRPTAAAQMVRRPVTAVG